MNYIKFALFLVFPVLFLLYYALMDTIKNRRFKDMNEDTFGCD